MLEAANSTTADLPPEQRRSVEGDKRLRRIARAGKKWKQTIGRTLDMEGMLRALVSRNLAQLLDARPAYVYRLCLEWARLWADDRDAMNFSL